MPPSVGSKGSLFLREIVEIEVLALFKKKITGHLLSPVCLKYPLLHSILPTAQCKTDGVTRQTSGNVTEIRPVCLGSVTAADQVELFDICAVL